MRVLFDNVNENGDLNKKRNTFTLQHVTRTCFNILQPKKRERTLSNGNCFLFILYNYSGLGNYIHLSYCLKNIKENTMYFD